MALQGSLDDFSLPDVFQLLSRDKTGALHLRGSSGAGTVYFKDGDIYYASSKKGDNLGNSLVRSGLIGADTWKAAVAKAGRKESVGSVLLADSDLDRTAFEDFIRERVEEAVFDLFRWEQGRFDFRADETHTLGPVFPLQVDPLIAEIRRRLDEWEIIKESVPSVTVGVRLVRTLPEDHLEVTLSREDWKIISCIDGTRRVLEVAEALGEGEFKTCQVLHGLVSAGLVETFEMEGGAAPEVEEVEEIPEFEEEEFEAEEEEEFEAEEEEEFEAEVEEEEEEFEAEDEEEEVSAGLSLAEAAEALSLEDDDDEISLETSTSFDELSADSAGGVGDDADLLDDLLGFSQASDGSEAASADSAGGGSKKGRGSGPTGGRRVNTAALAKEFSQLWSADNEGAGGSGPKNKVRRGSRGGRTSGAVAAEAIAEDHVEDQAMPPDIKSGGVNKALIMRLISGVKEL